jgi:23S rRNA (uracil1939-C5)-methyltransferase
MIGPGTELTLDIEKVAIGGRMIARHDGRVVLVAGAIPGEQVQATVERVQRDVLHAVVTAVHRAHPARRSPGRDPACGGMTYSHVAPDHQRRLKREMIADAFARIGRLELAADVPVAPSPESAYRMRARVHVRGGRMGSFREGSHEICDVAQTGQLSGPCLAALAAVAETCARHGVTHVDAVDLAENLDGAQRVVNLEQPDDPALTPGLLADLSVIDGVTGVTRTTRRGGVPRAYGGRPWVADTLATFTGGQGDDADALLRRHATAFFQANRFLTPFLAQRVTDALLDGPVLDLYSGAGLFALCAAARGHQPVVAIEGDAVSVSDLRENARPFARRVRVEHCPVEGYLQRARRAGVSTVIVDPPRTGMSKQAVAGVMAVAPSRIVYVSCDVATLARDAQRLVGSGYGLERLSAFDLFPNTPHVEVMAVFDRA